MAERVGLGDPIDAVFFQTVRKTKKNFIYLSHSEFDRGFCFPPAFPESDLFFQASSH